MFSTLFSKATELLGKAFLLSSFFPCLIGFLACEYVMIPKGCSSFFNMIIQNPKAGPIAETVIFLFLIYLTSYIVYGVRDTIVFFFRSGSFWILPPLRKMRRQHLISKRRKFRQQLDNETKKMNAIVWAEGGFSLVVDEANVAESDTAPDELVCRVGKQLTKLEKNHHASSPSFWKQSNEMQLAQIIQLMHRFSVAGKPDLIKGWVSRLRALAGGEHKLKELCQGILESHIPDLTDVFLPLWQYPQERYMQPTELGNVLSWIGTYPKERYGIEFEFLYPLIIKVIDKDYSTEIEERKIFFDFTTIFVFFAIVFPFAIIALAIWLPHGAVSIKWTSIGLVGFIVTAIGMYNLSLESARQYGVMLNGATDLFRLKVLDELRIPIPKNLKEEKTIWGKLNQSYLDRTVPELSLKTAK